MGIDFQEGEKPAVALDLTENPPVEQLFADHESLTIVITQDKFYPRPQVAGGSPMPQSLDLQELEGQVITRSLIRDSFSGMVRSFVYFLMFFMFCFLVIGLNIWNWMVSSISQKYRSPHTEHTKAEQRAVVSVALVPAFYVVLLDTLLPVAIPGFFLLVILVHIAFVRFGTKAVQAGFDAGEMN